MKKMLLALGTTLFFAMLGGIAMAGDDHHHHDGPPTPPPTTSSVYVSGDQLQTHNGGASSTGGWLSNGQNQNVFGQSENATGSVNLHQDQGYSYSYTGAPGNWVVVGNGMSGDLSGTTNGNGFFSGGNNQAANESIGLSNQGYKSMQSSDNLLFDMSIGGMVSGNAGVQSALETSGNGSFSQYKASGNNWAANWGNTSYSGNLSGATGSHNPSFDGSLGGSLSVMIYTTQDSTSQNSMLNSMSSLGTDYSRGQASGVIDNSANFEQYTGSANGYSYQSGSVQTHVGVGANPQP